MISSRLSAHPLSREYRGPPRSRLLLGVITGDGPEQRSDVAPDAANWFAPSSFPRRTWTAEDSHIPGWHLEGVVTSSVQAVACGVTRGPIVCAQRLKMARIKCKSAPALIRSASPARYHTMSDRLTHPLLEDTRRTDGVIKSQDYDGRERESGERSSVKWGNRSLCQDDITYSCKDKFTSLYY